MSLILDALRKADAERERGLVPGLNAQPVLPESVDAPSRRGTRPWLWAVVGIGVGLIAAAAAFVLVGEDDRPAVGRPSSAQAVAPLSAAASSASAPETRPASAIPLPAAEPAPWDRPAGRETRTSEPASTDSSSAAPRGDGAPQEVAVLTAPPVPVSNADLPAHIRSQLPALNLGGSMFSSNPANRSLIVNGRLLREKDQLTPDLVLEEIKPRAAVFGFKGYRFEVVF